MLTYRKNSYCKVCCWKYNWITWNVWKQPQTKWTEAISLSHFFSWSLLVINSKRPSSVGPFSCRLSRDFLARFLCSLPPVGTCIQHWWLWHFLGSLVCFLRMARPDDMSGHIINVFTRTEDENKLSFISSKFIHRFITQSYHTMFGRSCPFVDRFSSRFPIIF